jgi:hypothetical protein
MRKVKMRIVNLKVLKSLKSSLRRLQRNFLLKLNRE